MYIVQPAATLTFCCWQYRQRACCDSCRTVRSYDLFSVLSLGQVELDNQIKLFQEVNV